MRFEKTKGELRVKKVGFGLGVLRGLDLIWESATPPTFRKTFPPKNGFLDGFPFREGINRKSGNIWESVGKAGVGCKPKAQAW